MDLTVVDHPERSRFEARTTDGAVAGVVEYSREAGSLTLVHTEVEDGYEGKGVGSRLVSGTLAAVRHEGVSVVNDCPFIERYMRRHPGEYDWLERIASP
jgi:predicted GNAT family acetyltransferase